MQRYFSRLNLILFLFSRFYEEAVILRGAHMHQSVCPDLKCKVFPKKTFRQIGILVPKSAQVAPILQVPAPLYCVVNKMLIAKPLSYDIKSALKTGITNAFSVTV